MNTVRSQTALPRISDGSMGFLRKFGHLIKGAGNALVLGEIAVAQNLQDMGLSVDVFNARDMTPFRLMADVEAQTVPPRSQHYDLVLVVFPEFENAAHRQLVMRSLSGYVREGGVLLIHGLSTRHHGAGVDGFSTGELTSCLALFDVLDAADYDDVFGPAQHSGAPYAVVDFVGRKMS